jgi:hypothetical protein
VTIVQSRLLTPAGAAAGVTVYAQLVAPAGWLADHTGEIVQQATTVTAADGSWSMALTAQSLIEVTGTYYLITIPALGLLHTCVVPAVGPVQLRDALVDPKTLNPIAAGTPTLYVARTDYVAAGDVLVASSGNTPARVPVGTTNQVLTADPTQPSGVKWASPSAAAGVNSVTAADTTVVVAGTAANPTVKVGTNVPQSAVATLPTDLAARLLLSTVTAKGDLLAATGNAAITRLPVGTNGQLVVADSTQAAGVKWASPAPAAAIPKVRYAWITTGDTVMPNTAAAWQALAGYELDVPAVTGDHVELGFSAMRNVNSNTFLDIGVLVGTTIVRFLATGTNTPALEGDPAFYQTSSGFVGHANPRSFTTVAGDIDGVNVRFVVVVKSTGAGTLYSSANYPFYWRGVNYGVVA